LQMSVGLLLFIIFAAYFYKKQASLLLNIEGEIKSRYWAMLEEGF
jgi:hypothetical protein